ncbi:nucleotide sugar dehydrogenase [Candidatus Gottesmanbacteria bacterium]|nr:nucleotide sugar dehydrogenase [Candidatus Gottesmanbacteria bacterium]
MSTKKTAAVIGIGRVGLPMALYLAEAGLTVYGIGRSQEKIDDIGAGKMPFMEKDGEKFLKKHVNKRFIPTTDYSFVSHASYIILTLGTPIDENMNPVYDQIDAAITSIAPYLKKGQTMILRSTVAPKTTEYVRSLLADLRGITVGKNFYLAFCPERIAEGYALEEMKTLPQIVGGSDGPSTRKAVEFFKRIGVQTLATDAVSAELAKLFTNMYRYISFAIANEFMVIAGNYHRDIYEIVRLVNTGYKRGGLKLPGLTSGPCLFKDGFFLISDLPFADLISTSWKINESTPLFLVKKVKERINLNGKKVAILGLAFKAEIDDIRESLSFKIRKAMLRERAVVTLHDPLVQEYANQEITRDVYEAAKGANVLFVATNHSAYGLLDLKKLKKTVAKNCIFCDVWNVFGTNKIVFTINQLYKNGTKSNEENEK